MSRVLGAVLAGGASSRFGSDKAVAVWDGSTLLDRANDLLADVVDELMVVGRAGGVPDFPAPGWGPLGGIAGALRHAERNGFSHVLTIGCDMPVVPRELLAMLLAGAPSCCADAPVLGHWPTSAGEALCASLSARPEHRGAKDAGLSVRRWAASIGATMVASPAPLHNINRPQDLLAS